MFTWAKSFILILRWYILLTQQIKHDWEDINALEKTLKSKTYYAVLFDTIYSSNKDDSYTTMLCTAGT